MTRWRKERDGLQSRVAALAAELEEAIANFADPNDKRRIRALEAALRQARPYVYNAEVADAADLEARYCVLNVIDALLVFQVKGHYIAEK